MLKELTQKMSTGSREESWLYSRNIFLVKMCKLLLHIWAATLILLIVTNSLVHNIAIIWPGIIYALFLGIKIDAGKNFSPKSTDSFLWGEDTIPSICSIFFDISSTLIMIPKVSNCVSTLQSMINHNKVCISGELASTSKPPAFANT